MADSVIDEPAELPACPVPRMPRVQDPTPEMAAIIAEREENSDEAEFYRRVGHAPDIVSGFMDHYLGLLKSTRVPLRTKELARLRIARLNACFY